MHSCIQGNNLAFNFTRLLASRSASFTWDYFSLAFFPHREIFLILDELLTSFCLLDSELYNLSDEASSLRLPRGPDSRIQPEFHRSIPSFTLGSSDNQRDKLSSFSLFTLRELMGDAPFEDANRKELEKPAFLLGDLILDLEESLFENECK